MISYNTLVVLLGTSFLGANAGLIGTFAVLRRRSLMGDALAHAALPGLCVAFLILGERNLPAMQLGALATGVAGVMLIAGLRRGTRIKEDAAIGIVLSVFFGLGIVLLRMIQSQTTSGSKAGLDSYIYGKTAGMLASDVYFIAGMSGACLLTVLLLFKEFRVVSFDPEFSRTQGFPTFWLDLLLMLLVSVTVVIGLPAAGAVMISALLILPAAAARFWTDRLSRTLLLAALIGAVIGASGTALSASYAGLPTGPVIVVLGTLVFLSSVLFSPRRGVVARVAQDWQLRRRIQDQRLLRLLAHASLTTANRQQLRIQDFVRTAHLSRAEAQRVVTKAKRRGWLEDDGAEGVRLTAAGTQASQRADRSYRVWQILLREYPDQIGGSLNLDFETAEANLPAPLLREVTARLSPENFPAEPRTT